MLTDQWYVENLRLDLPILVDLLSKRYVLRRSTYSSRQSVWRFIAFHGFARNSLSMSTCARVTSKSSAPYSLYQV